MLPTPNPNSKADNDGLGATLKAPKHQLLGTGGGAAGGAEAPVAVPGPVGSGGGGSGGGSGGGAAALDLTAAGNNEGTVGMGDDDGTFKYAFKPSTPFPTDPTP